MPAEALVPILKLNQKRNRKVVRKIGFKKPFFQPCLLHHFLQTLTTKQIRNFEKISTLKQNFQQPLPPDYNDNLPHLILMQR